MDGYIERQTLQDIADAIRAKNGSSDTYTPSEMAEAIRGIEGGGEGFDLIQYGVSKDFQDKINNNFLENIAYTIDFWKGKENLSSYQNVCKNNKRVMFVPFQLPKGKSYFEAFSGSMINFTDNIPFGPGDIRNLYNKATLQTIPEYIDLTQCSNALQIFDSTTIINQQSKKIKINVGYKANKAVMDMHRFLYGSTAYLKEIEIIGDRISELQYAFFAQPLISIKIESIENHVKSFANWISSSVLKVCELGRYKQTNIPLTSSPVLLPSSIHYIIQNAMSVADGATARTLTLHATAKANWEASEYYEQDLAVLTDKGITIA